MKILLLIFGSGRGLPLGFGIAGIANVFLIASGTVKITQALRIITALDLLMLCVWICLFGLAWRNARKRRA